ncbi:MAG: GNAT family N-acetyltransferase [Acidimicrobiia bacterium]
MLVARARDRHADKSFQRSNSRLARPRITARRRAAPNAGSRTGWLRRDNRFVNLAYPKPELRSDKVHLRKWSLEDLGCVEAAPKDPEIPRGTTVPALYSEEDGRAWIKRQWSRQISGHGLSMAIADPTTGEARGLVYLGLRRIEGHCELGYWLVPDARGHGLGTAAIRLVSRWVLLDTGVYRLVAYAEPHNLGSCALLRKCGFTEEGLLRSYLRFHDGVFDALSFSLLTTDLD